MKVDESKTKRKRMKKLVAILALNALIFIVATYAWFIGMRQVSVSSFEIEIASTDSLLLSLDGNRWDTTVTINSENFQTVSYEGNVNNWAGYDANNRYTGLKPISSIGEIDTATSTLKMFEKGSLTATPGGYRLLASRIHNYETNQQRANSVNAYGNNTENGGYIAFDLFIRNFSGHAYYADDDIYNEEAIYLTTDSEVIVGSTGVADTGIENSVRIAFAQIGRVNGTTTDVATITGIKCLPGENSPVTGICRVAQIWEPNDTAHVVDAISFYDTSCRLRPAAESPATDPTDIRNASAYTLDSHCGTVANGTARNTYAIGRVIDIIDKVDVYDGAQYNGYTATTRTTYSGAQPLYAYDYFTDTEKDLAGMSRPTFISLAPNSITKVRVYVWLEGQDIDNYDFSTIGKQIEVKFGFTKERFTEEEAQGQGPLMPTGDIVRPVISGVANSPVSLTTAQAATYDPLTGVTVSDIDNSETQAQCTTPSGTWGTTGKCVVNGIVGAQSSESDCTNDSGTWITAYCTHDLTTKLQVTNPVKNEVGSYVVRYLVSDWQGNYAEKFITVNVTSGE